MVDQGGLPQGTSRTSDSQPKRRWNPPTIEEIDYDATAAAPIAFGGADLGAYSG
jgi:hypothetical protein